QGKPQLTVIDDIHDADSASLEVLRHMLAVPARGPELLVLTSTPDAKPVPPSDAVLTIEDLGGAELQALIADRLGSAATPARVAAVLSRAGGNPLFVEEIARAIVAGADLPATVRDVV